MRILSLVLVAVVVLGLVSGNNAYAGDEGWYAAGGLLAGLVAGAIITDASRPRYYYAEPACATPVYAYPVYHRPVYHYNTYRTYSYASPCSTTTVYETIHTW